MSTRRVIEGIAEKLDGSQATPLYEQLTLLLRAAIEQRELAPGAVIPPEPELASLLGVGRQTVNLALTRLAQRGLVTRKRGTGTFVAEPFVEQGLNGLYSFIHTLESQGRHPGARLLGFRQLYDDRASALLGDAPTDLVYEIKRLRLVDGEPFAVETTYLPVACGQALPLDRIETTPLYELLEEACGLRVTRAKETLRPVTLERDDASLLGLVSDEPAFLVERVGFAGDRAVELRLSLIRGDRYRFTVDLTHSEGAPLA